MCPTAQAYVEGDEEDCPSKILLFLPSVTGVHITMLPCHEVVLSLLAHDAPRHHVAAASSRPAAAEKP
jgi:hypothetical protein